MLERNEVLYFVKIVGYKAFVPLTRTGGRWSADASALGKVLMAFGPTDPLQLLPPEGLKPLTPYTIIDPQRMRRELALVRRAGSAIESQEAVLGNACVAAPIFGAAGQLVAAVSVSGPPLRLRPTQRAPIVRRTAAKITQRISGKSPEAWY